MGRTLVLGCIIAVVSCAPEEPAERAPLADDLGQDGVPSAAADTPKNRTLDPASSLAAGRRTEPSAGRTTDQDPADKDIAGNRGTQRTRRSQDPVLASGRAESSHLSRSPNRCERLRAQVDDKGRRRFRRIRKTWTKADQLRFSKLVGLVAKEMGADPRLIKAWAMRESTYRPQAMHVLNPDLEAAMASWRRFHYSAEEEAELQALMAESSKQSGEYWKAKARLHQVQTFRDNPYLDDIVEFEVMTEDGELSHGTEPAWAFGYGPFGFNPAYFVPVWDSRSPPWVFCDDNGLVAIITAVWAARTSQRECAAQGFGDSYAIVNRRFSRGHCGEVGPHANFRGRARRLGLDPDARAKLGRKWRRAETDRAQMLRHMRGRAVAAGLLPPRPHSPGA